jgi:membrane-associated phospholipid phosphatase
MREVPSRHMPRRAAYALFATLACAGTLVAAWIATFWSSGGRWLDAAALQGFVALDRSATRTPAEVIASIGDPLPFVLLGAALVAVALARGRPRIAIAVPVVLAGAAGTSQVLKPLLADARVCHCLADSRVAEASWPSGHATAAMALGLCAVLVSPSGWRPTMAVAGAVAAVGVSYSLLTLGWHYPSDVLAGFLVAALWMAAALTGLWSAAERWPARTGREAAVRWGSALAPAAIGAILSLLPLAALALARPDGALRYAEAHTTFVFVAATIAATAAATAGAFAAVLRR